MLTCGICGRNTNVLVAHERAFPLPIHSCLECARLEPYVPMAPYSGATQQSDASLCFMNPTRRDPRYMYQQGDHICTLYSSPEEQLRAAGEYIREGLDRRERCLYICCEHDVATFRRSLKMEGIDVPAEEARGALVLLTKHDGHLKGGSFDPTAMLAMLEWAVRDALDDGFSGLCVAGDMTWLLDEAPGSEKIIEYEAALNRFFHSHRALGLCQYRRTMPASLLDHCLATHALVRTDGPILLTNPFYEPPEQAVSRRARPQDVESKLRHFDTA